MMKLELRTTGGGKVVFRYRRTDDRFDVDSFGNRGLCRAKAQELRDWLTERLAEAPRPKVLFGLAGGKWHTLVSPNDGLRWVATSMLDGKVFNCILNDFEELVEPKDWGRS